MEAILLFTLVRWIKRLRDGVPEAKAKKRRLLSRKTYFKKMFREVKKLDKEDFECPLLRTEILRKYWSLTFTSTLYYNNTELKTYFHYQESIKPVQRQPTRALPSIRTNSLEDPSSVEQYHRDAQNTLIDAPHAGWTTSTKKCLSPSWNLQYDKHALKTKNINVPSMYKQPYERTNIALY